METISKAALVAFAFGTVAIAGQADAQTVVRFPVKGGVPYTVTRENPKIATAPHHVRYVVSTIGGHTVARVANN